MAANAYTAGKVAADELLYVAYYFDVFAYTPATFSGALPTGASLTEEEALPERGPGDYLAVFASGTLGATREVLYVAPPRATGVIREIVLTNITSAAALVRLWLGGVVVEPGAIVPAGESRSESVPGWLVKSGESFEAQGAGVSVLAFGVEEVS